MMKSMLILVGVTFLAGCGAGASGQDCMETRDNLIATKGRADQFFNSDIDGVRTQVWYYGDGSSYEFEYTNHGTRCTWRENLASIAG